MGTSQNYALPWPEPTDTQMAFPALAKTLAENVDTELKNLDTKNLTQDSQIGVIEGDISDLIDGLNLVDSEKVDGAGMTVRFDTTVGTRILLDHPGGTTMLYGDTGWRDLSGLLTNGWTGNIYARRVNDLVELRVEWLSASAATSGAALALPITSAFRLATGTPHSARGLLHTTSATIRRYHMTQNLVVSGYQAADTLYGAIFGTASNTWGTVSEGTPA